VERVPAEKNVVSVEGRFLTRAEFHRLADVPPETEWFANLDNENTRLAYRNDVGDFIRFAGIERPEEMRQVTRAHVLKWRKSLEDRVLSPASIRRRLSSLSALFNYLCERKLALRCAEAVGGRRMGSDPNFGQLNLRAALGCGHEGRSPVLVLSP
jgi:hypothetical protein